MKRSFSNREVDTNLALANCLMLLSRGNKYEHVEFDSIPTQVFECKTCNRQFHSFQALGGHRASHKKPKLAEADCENQPSPAKPKTHQCSICGLEFAIGQALGGHMRRHRGVLRENQHGPLSLAPTVKKSNIRRVLCLDLNLTPLENDLELFKLGKGVPTINFFL